MYKLLLIFTFSLTFISCSYSGAQEGFTLNRDEGFPQWLEGTDQTSGITFIGLDKSGDKNFLLADDIGKIHRLIISNDTVITRRDIVLLPEVTEYLSPFPKWDFEEIVFDKYTGRIFLSIEGNGPDFKNYVGIYELGFINNTPFNDTIASIKRLQFTPSEQFLAHTDKNIGYEGVAVDEKYFYLGLEGFQLGPVFSDSTIIYIADKTSLEIVDSINTKIYGIGTVCGLYSDSSKSLYGIDRNGRRAFHIIFNSELKIQSCILSEIKPEIPVFHFEYISALESVAMDNERNLYFIDDPWKKFYTPSSEVLEKTDQRTRDNFRNVVPIIYKFNISY